LNIFSTFDFSEICKRRNVWKLPNPFSRNTLISSSEKFKNIILEEKLSNEFKNGHEKFLCKLHGFGTSKQEVLNYGNLYNRKFLIAIFEFVGQLFFQNDVFKL
jgi:hypothetical protein